MGAAKGGNISKKNDHRRKRRSTGGDLETMQKRPIEFLRSHPEAFWSMGRKKGGPLRTRKRAHHDFGGFIEDAGRAIMNTAPMWLPFLLKKGGSVDK